MSDASLWRAVIMQALNDAEAQFDRPNQRRGGGSLTLHDRNATREWLTMQSRDFIHVCHLAGLDPDAVREQALKRIAAADAGKPIPRRMRPGGGPQHSRAFGDRRGEHRARDAQNNFSKEAASQ